MWQARAKVPFWKGKTQYTRHATMCATYVCFTIFSQYPHSNTHFTAISRKICVIFRASSPWASTVTSSGSSSVVSRQHSLFAQEHNTNHTRQVLLHFQFDKLESNQIAFRLQFIFLFSLFHLFATFRPFRFCPELVCNHVQQLLYDVSCRISA